MRKSIFEPNIRPESKTNREDITLPEANTLIFPNLILFDSFFHKISGNDISDYCISSNKHTHVRHVHKPAQLIHYCHCWDVQIKRFLVVES